MKNSLLIAKRDLGTYFNSPIFYVLTSVFIFVYSWSFLDDLARFAQQSLRAIQMGGVNINLNEKVITPSFKIIGNILLLMIPLITMRSFAEDHKTKSIILLLSSPVRLREILLGKFLACFAVVALMILLTTYSIGCLFWVGEPEIGPILTGYLGMLLMLGCYVSVGIFASSLTNNQIVAATTSFGIILFMVIIGWGARATVAGVADVLQFLSLVDHQDRFLTGIIDTSDVLYYLSFIALSLFLTHRVLDSKRWM